MCNEKSNKHIMGYVGHNHVHVHEYLCTCTRMLFLVLLLYCFCGCACAFSVMQYVFPPERGRGVLQLLSLSYFL